MPTARAPWSLNSFNTGAAFLLSISSIVRDSALETLFNAITIVADMRQMFDGGSGHEGAKCKVENFMVACLPREMDLEYVEVVITEFRTIFPCSVNLKDRDGRRYEVRSRWRDV